MHALPGDCLLQGSETHTLTSARCHAITRDALLSISLEE